MVLDQDRVPTHFDEAIELLNAALSDAEKDAWETMTAADLFDLHANLAHTLREDWSLNDANTPLRLFFRELGLDDAEEVSLLLIDACWRLHNHESIPLMALVAEYLED